MKIFLFTITLVFSISGHSFFFESDTDKVRKASELFEKSTKALNLGDVYSACKFYREANEKIYEIKSEIPTDVKTFLSEANRRNSEYCKGY